MSGDNGIRLLVFCFVAAALVTIFPGVTIAESNPEQTIESVLTGTAADPETDVFTYKAAGRRDPFEPLVTKLKKISRVVVKPRGPLQKYELSQFRLMAVLVVKGRPMAMVKAPDGKSYPVKIGNEIGRYEGRVVNIEIKVTKRDNLGKRIEKSPDRIVVEETVRDNFTGKHSVEYRYLTM